MSQERTQNQQINNQQDIQYPKGFQHKKHSKKYKTGAEKNQFNKKFMFQVPGYTRSENYRLRQLAQQMMGQMRSYTGKDDGWFIIEEVLTNKWHQNLNITLEDIYLIVKYDPKERFECIHKDSLDKNNLIRLKQTNVLSMMIFSQTPVRFQKRRYIRKKRTFTNTNQ